MQGGKLKSKKLTWIKSRFVFLLGLMRSVVWSAKPALNVLISGFSRDVAFAHSYILAKQFVSLGRQRLNL